MTMTIFASILAFVAVYISAASLKKQGRLSVGAFRGIVSVVGVSVVLTAALVLYNNRNQ